MCGCAVHLQHNASSIQSGKVGGAWESWSFRGETMLPDALPVKGGFCSGLGREQSLLCCVQRYAFSAATAAKGTGLADSESR